jgi:prevent-host-death family protein
MLDILLDMKTVTIRELLHDSARIMRVVERGGTVCITRRGRPVARLVPEQRAVSGNIEWPDVLARARGYCGDTMLTDEDVQRVRDGEERFPQ